MTLQTQQVHLAHAQESRIVGSVRRVTTGATLCFHRHVLIDKRTLFVDVTLGTDGIAGRHRLYLPERRGAVGIMAITATNEVLVDTVVIGHCEVGLGGRMASVAKVGLRAH